MRKSDPPHRQDGRWRRCCKNARLWTVGLTALLWFLYLIWQGCYISLPNSHNPLYSYHSKSRSDLHLLVKKAIHSARKEISLSTFHLSDPAIVSSLRSAEKRGVHLTAHTDPSSPKHPWSVGKAKGLWHEKILIIDGTTSYLGSANLTEDSLRMQDNRIFALYSPALAEALAAENPNPFFSSVGPSEIEVWRLPHKEALNRLVELLNNAQKTIDVAMYTLTHPLLIEALINAAKRGVYVTALLDSASKPAGAKLKKEGIAVKIAPAYPLMHRKEALIDGTTQIFGSANWTKGAFAKNKDYFVVLKKAVQ